MRCRCRESCVRHKSFILLANSDCKNIMCTSYYALSEKRDYRALKFEYQYFIRQFIAQAANDVHSIEFDLSEKKYPCRMAIRRRSIGECKVYI